MAIFIKFFCVLNVSFLWSWYSIRVELTFLVGSTILRCYYWVCLRWGRVYSLRSTVGYKFLRYYWSTVLRYRWGLRFCGSTVWIGVTFSPLIVTVTGSQYAFPAHDADVKIITSSLQVKEWKVLIAGSHPSYHHPGFIEHPCPFKTFELHVVYWTKMQCDLSKIWSEYTVNVKRDQDHRLFGYTYIVLIWEHFQKCNALLLLTRSTPPDDFTYSCSLWSSTLTLFSSSLTALLSSFTKLQIRQNSG